VWDDHADQLTVDGFIELGGPLGEGDGEDLGPLEVNTVN